MTEEQLERLLGILKDDSDQVSSVYPMVLRKRDQIQELIEEIESLTRNNEFDNGYECGYNAGFGRCSEITTPVLDLTKTHPEMCKELEDALNEADKS